MILRKIRVYAILLFLVLAGTTGCIENGTDTAPGRKTHSVRKVIDGDTIELANGKRLRYIGINTPEVRKRSGRQWVYAPEPYALEAKDLNTALVAGRKVELEFDVEKQDKYGRWLAYVYVDNVMVNEDLLYQGYAKLMTIPPNTRYYNRLKTAEKDARQSARGIWSK